MPIKTFSLNSFWVILLLSTAWSILATSGPWNDLEYGSYHEASDCVQPPLEHDVVLSAGQITLPGGVSHTDFGFPNATVQQGQVNAGTVGSVYRECRTTYSSGESPTDDDNSFVFSCFDNGTYSCSIVFVRN